MPTTRRRRATPPSKSNSRGWRAGLPGASRRSCSAPTSSRARWKPRCARPASAITSIGGQSYFDRREIKDFLAYLKTFINPHDDISLLRIANVPARGLSEVTMERLLAASQERGCPVFDAMRHPDVLAGFVPKTRAARGRFRGVDRAASGRVARGRAFTEAMGGEFRAGD